MAKINIQAGDIPETDQEVEQELVKLDRREAQKRGRLAEKKAAQEKAAQEQEAVANHEPGQPLPEDAAERAASGSGWQGEDVQVYHGTERIVKEKPATKPKAARKKIIPVVTLDGNQQVVTDDKTKKALNSREKRGAKKVETAKPKRETGVSKVTAQVVLTVFELARAGKSNAEIAAAESIPSSYIGTILVAHPNWVKHTLVGFEAMGKQYPERFTRPSKAVQNRQVQP
jgi:hypothetical protein